MKKNVLVLLISMLISMLLHARNDDYSYYNQPSFTMPRIEAFKVPEIKELQFAKDIFEGGFKGDFIEKPNLANSIGNLLVVFSPAYIVANTRDFVANFKSSYEDGFKKVNVPLALCSVGFIPGIIEAKGIAKTLKVAKEIEVETKLGIEFAPVIEKSGLTHELQRAIITNINEGEIVAVRRRVYGANFFDGELPVKAPAMAEVDIKYGNGVRLLKDGNRVTSDVDLAFMAKNGKPITEFKTIQFGEKINQTYGHVVVTHGDNFNGVKKGIDAALKVEKKNERIWIFNKDGYIDSGRYQTMIDKYISSGR